MLLWIVRVLLVGVSVAAALHALLYKRDSRSALGWVVLCLVLPGIGALLYGMLGVNRIRTRARKYGERWRLLHQTSQEQPTGEAADLIRALPPHLLNLVRSADTVTRRPLMGGNRVEPLMGGEAVYDRMRRAIADAEHTIMLSSYIYDNDATGRSFAEVLAVARRRGVRVRVLLDGFGEWYSRPRVRHLLRREQIPFAIFLPFTLWRSRLHLNLRNHRKILAVDGKIGFTGGINISDRHLLKRLDNPRRVVDLHFAIEGPVVREMEEAFLEDWIFASAETDPPVMSPTARAVGNALCRGISAGPNEDFEKLQWIVLAALGSARDRVRIMTPYFVPNRVLITALNAAALRGVEVELLLPENSNLPPVDWVSRAQLWEVLERGVRVFFQPGPFDHSKLLLVDDYYALVGSANLDNRSLRLNFEFNLEVYDSALAGELSRHVDFCRERSREVTLQQMNARPLPIRLRDATARLFAPYL